MTTTLPHQQVHGDHGRTDTQQPSVVVDPQTASGDQRCVEPHSERVAAGPNPPADQAASDIHPRTVGGAPTPDQAKYRAAPNEALPGRAQTPTFGQGADDAQSANADGGPNSPDQATASASPKGSPPGRVQNSPATKKRAETTPSPSSGTQDSATGQGQSGHHSPLAGGALNVSQVDQSSCDTQSCPVDLADPLLALAADVLDDLETVRVANENRLRQLTRAVEDKDGEERGFGLTLDHPDVARLSALVDLLRDAEKHAERNLTYRMKKHPLGPWVKHAKGVGEKQAARLLAAVGDPYWNDLHGRPRLVSELWSYCGYGDSSRQVRRKGVKANWSDDARKRAHLVAEKCKMQLTKPCYSVKGDDGLVSHTVHIDGECTCSRYRLLYDGRKAHYAGSVHSRECNRCTGKGQPPAPDGSPRKPAHIDAMALRAVKKEILRDLWRESRRLHEPPGDQTLPDTHPRSVAGAPNSHSVQRSSDTHVCRDGVGPHVLPGQVSGVHQGEAAGESST